MKTQAMRELVIGTVLRLILLALLVLSLSYIYHFPSLPFYKITVVCTEKHPENVAQILDEVQKPESMPGLQQVQLAVDINTATKEALMELPGIGEVLAERILAYREENGNFYDVEELMNVSGIGEKKFNEVKAFVFIDSPKK